MVAIDILGKPPATSVIEAARAKAGSAGRTAERAFWLTPPLLDILLVPAIVGVDRLINGASRDALEPVPGADARDWSPSPTAAAYVAQVRKMCRPLVRAEVAALDDHLAKVRSGMLAARVASEVEADLAGASRA